MAQLVKKTPMELFGSDDVAIKPHRFAMRTRWEPDYSKPTNGGWSGQKSRQPFRNGMPAQAQNLANVFNEPVGTHDPQYKERIPRSRVGPYGTVKLPEQWKYKTGTDIANAMTRAAKIDTTDEDSIWDAFEGGKITEEQRNKMLSERTGRIANKGRNAK